ncbi:MAG: DNA endonuclease SmrA [Cellvibrionaceae bacterium]
MSDNSLSDEEAFRQAMGDVEPIAHTERVALKSQVVSAESKKARRESAVNVDEEQRNSLSGEYIEPLEPNALLNFHRPGVQHGVFKKLRLGKYAIEARLDLHRHTVEQARTAVYTFVNDCIAHDIRCALITHGKGEGRKQPALLKSCVAHWLPQLDPVLAFHSAQKQHGASGATYILLKKSERKRLDNLERHQKRRL